MKDKELQRTYNRQARKRERDDLRQFRLLKKTLKQIPEIQRKIIALKTSKAFCDVGLLIEPLIVA